MGPEDRTAPMLIPTEHGKLAVDIAGDRKGLPVFLFHGTPGSRSGPRPRPSVLYRRGICLVSYDRPGYGESTAQPGRTVADAAGDVRTIADELEIDKFAVVGRSGGGPHALACAALLNGRVTSAAALVSVAPPDVPGLDWMDGMGDGNVEAYGLVGIDQVAYADALRQRAEEASANPGLFLEKLRTEMTALDRQVTRDVGISRTLTATYAEALKHGPQGWLDDLMALRTNWAFGLDDVRCPVLLWHGERDNFSPVAHTYWLAKLLPQGNVKVNIDPGTAHFGAVKVLLDTFRWLAAPDMATSLASAVI